MLSGSISKSVSLFRKGLFDFLLPNENTETLSIETNIAQRSDSLIQNDKGNQLLSEDGSCSSWSSLDEISLHENPADDTNQSPAEAILSSLRTKSELVQHEVKSGDMNCRGVMQLKRHYSEVKISVNFYFYFHFAT